MKSSTLISIIVVLVLVGGGIYFYQSANTATPNENEQTTNENTNNTSTTTEDETANNSTTTTDNTESTSNTVVVTYTENGFSPETIDVSVGDTVQFVNESDSAMWVGSDVHPTHANYSGSNLQDHCPDTNGTAFDQCGVGTSYEFTFEKTGEWKYHNHRRANHGGTIVVTQ